MQGVTKQMSLIFPVMIFAFSFLFPEGLAIYWVTGTMFMVAQQYHLLGWNGLKVPSWFPGAGRVTALTIPRTPVTPYKGAAGAKKAAIVAGNGKNGTGATKNIAGPAAQNGTKNGTKNGTAGADANEAAPAEDGDESGRSPSAQARSLARPNRPNRRRRRR
jgi:hypothetical protein